MTRRLLEVVLLFFSFYLPGFVSGSPSSEQVSGYMVQYVIAAVPQTLLVVYILWIQNEVRSGDYGLSGFRWRDALHGVLLFGALFAVFFAFSLFISLLPEEVRRAFAGGYRWRLSGLSAVPLAALFSLVVGYREEVFFRSYLINRFAQMGASPALAAGFSTAVFSLGHVYQGWAGILYALLHGALFAVAFLKTRRIHVVAVAHGLYNLAVLLLGTIVMLGG